MAEIDKFTLNLLKAISEGLETATAGFDQYFSFEIRGKIISGTLTVEIEDVELKSIEEKS